MKQFVLGFSVCMILWIILLSAVEVPEYIIIDQKAGCTSV